MNFLEFMGILNGEYKETAGTSARNQCVDLANAYIKFVLQLPIIEWTNAVDFPSKAGDNYEYILNTPTGVPTEGDLVVWSSNHIAIFMEGDANRFTSFDENWPIGSPCHVQEHTYNNVIGWLHPKNVLPDLQTQLDRCREERDRNWNFFIGLCDILKSAHNFEIAKAELKKLIGIEDKLLEKDGQLETSKTKISELENRIKELEKQAPVVVDTTTQISDKVDKVVDEVHENTQTVKTFDDTIKEALQAINEAKEAIQTGSDNGWELIVKGFKKLFHLR